MFSFIKLFITLSFGMLLLVGSGDSSSTDSNTNATENNNTGVEGVTTDEITTDNITTETNNDNETETTQNTIDTNNSNIWKVSNISEFRQTLENAAANGKNDTIILAKGTYNVASDKKGTLEFDDEEEFNLTIIAEDGLNANDVILDGDNKHQIFNFDNPKATLSFKNISISNGKNTSDGAGIYSNANTIVENCTISNNYVDSNNRSGGGIYGGKNITIINSTFSKNHAWAGGGFYSPFGSYTNINKSSFNDNTAGFGGAFTSYSTDVIHSTFQNNTAERNGGAIRAGNATIKNSSFATNSSKGFGGAVKLINSRISNISNTSFFQNNASYGGAIDAGDLILVNSTFLKNDATTKGGIAFLRGKAYISNNNFSENKGSLEARGIFINNIFNKNIEDLFIVGDSKIYNNYIDENKVNENDYTVITKDNIQASLGDILLSNDGMSLQTGSEAIDKGLNPDSDKYMEIIDNMTDYRVILDLLQTDKVGNKRVHNATIDIGAVEFGSSK